MEKYSLFLLSAIFSMTVFFVFVNLWYTDGFREQTNSPMHSLMIIAAIITILFSVFIISYVYWYMMRERAKSFSILLSYGMTYKDLRRLIITETFFIYAVSLGIAFITGGVFSKLFFMISTKLLMIENIEYKLTIESFLVTAVVFIVIFVSVYVIGLIQISLKDLVELGKAKKDVELKGNGNAFLGYFGLILLIGSMTALYFHNQQSIENMTQWILGVGSMCFIGSYLLISHFSRLLYGRLKTNSKRYYNHMLEASEFAMSYRQNRKTIFVMTLLTFGIILFTSVTYTLYKEAYHMAEKENPHDLYFQVIDAKQIMNENDVIQVMSQYADEIREIKSMPFLYMEAPKLLTSNWRSWKWIPVVSKTAYNESFHTDYELESGEIMQVIFESDLQHDLIFFEDEFVLKNSVQTYKFQMEEPIYDKIMNRYIFTQPIILIVNDNDFNHFINESVPMESGRLYMYQFNDWKQSEDISSAFRTRFYEKYDNLKLKDKMVYEELIQRYGYSHLQVRTKIDYLKVTKMQGSFSLFIMGFVSILFAFCIFITYYFKVFIGSSEDIERFRKLDGVGMTSKEKERLIKTRIGLLMFVPSILGVILGSGWCIAINFKKLIEVELSNMIIMRNSLIACGIFMGGIVIYYMMLKSTYIKRLRL